MRMDMNGNNLWSRKNICTNQDYVFSIISTPDDGALLTGITSNGGYNASWICKLNKDGEIQWAKKYYDITPYSHSSFSQSIYKDGYYYVYGNRTVPI